MQCPACADRLVIAVCILLGASGCGGGPVDPFSRVPITGTVTVDGQNVAWGGITFKGKREEKTQEQAIATYLIRDGQIVEDPGVAGTTAGDNDVSVVVYAEDPSDETKTPVIKGTWLGKLQITGGEPLKLNIEGTTLEKPSRN